jgi:hypothetical protein
MIEESVVDGLVNENPDHIQSLDVVTLMRHEFFTFSWQDRSSPMV